MAIITQTLIQECNSNGIILFVTEEESLSYKTQTGKISKNIVQRLKLHKNELIKFLTTTSSDKKSLRNKRGGDNNIDFIRHAKELLQQTPTCMDLFAKHGISRQTLWQLWIGIIQKTEVDYELIFPCSFKSWYSCMVTIPSDPGQVVDIKLGSPTFFGEGLGVFGMKAAYKEPKRTVFVTRTLIDCLSIMETGNLAIFAPEGKNDDLIEFCKTKPRTPIYESYKDKLIVFLYEAHSNFAKNQILSGNLTCVSISQIPQQYKSLNEILVSDRCRFITFLNSHKTEHRD